MQSLLQLKIGAKRPRKVRYTSRYEGERIAFKQNIRSVNELKANLRHGSYAWPGGYPIVYLTQDGGTLAPDTVVDNLKSVIDSIKNNYNDGWKVVAAFINDDPDSEIYDDHTGKLIQ